jgi:hypothetical protein
MHIHTYTYIYIHIGWGRENGAADGRDAVQVVSLTTCTVFWKLVPSFEAKEACRGDIERKKPGKKVVSSTANKIHECKRRFEAILQRAPMQAVRFVGAPVEDRIHFFFSSLAFCANLDAWSGRGKSCRGRGKSFRCQGCQGWEYTW